MHGGSLEFALTVPFCEKRKIQLFFQKHQIHQIEFKIFTFLFIILNPKNIVAETKHLFL